MSPNPERAPGRAELVQLADVLARRFLQRRDLYPRQLDDGRYATVHAPLRPEHVLAHLEGELTLGMYLLDPESRGRCLVLDADDEPNWRRLKALARALTEQGGAAYLESSRRGGHLWCFFAAPMAGREIRAFGRGLAAYYRIEEVELFPKQERLQKGPGSLVRLPFGVHRVTGRRYGFCHPDGRPLAPTLSAQIQLLAGAEALPEAVFSRFRSYSPAERQKDEPEPLQKAQGRVLASGEGLLSERIKAAIPVRQFVLRYVELSPAGRGLCPFHDDHHESFSVDDEGNFWHCFAGCGGGSIIDFWMRWQACDFRTAVTELAAMLP